MTDICKCSGENCDKRETCFRYLAKDGYYQSYFSMPNSKDCKSYWKVENEEELASLQKAWED